LRDRLWRVAWKQALACVKKSALRSLRVGRWTHGVKPQRITGSGCAQLPLCPQWSRMKSDRGRQYRNASRSGHGEIRPQTRAVSGSAALVTTPLRSPVTRAASLRHARRQAFACHRACDLWSDAVLRAVNTCPLGSPVAAGRGPALGTRVGGSRRRGGQGLGTAVDSCGYPGAATGRCRSPRRQIRLPSQRGQTRENDPTLDQRVHSRSGGLNTALIIVFGGIHPRTDGIRHQLAGGRRVEIAHEFGLVGDSCIQPQVIMGRGDEGRHALMQ